jgi:hypothetical protein
MRVGISRVKDLKRRGSSVERGDSVEARVAHEREEGNLLP